MSEAFTAILEILKYILPSIVVFLTVYYLMKYYIEGQLRMKSMDLNKKRSSESLPIRLQSFERLTLFCERIRLKNLILRLNSTNMTPDELGNAMLIAIHKEFEHNAAQQVYVSENLWNIISFAKNQNIELIHAALSYDGEFLKTLSDLDSERQINPVDAAIISIRKEMSVYLS